MNQPENRFLCSRVKEHCFRCGARLVSTFEVQGYNRDSGDPEFAAYHSCPNSKGSFLYRFFLGDPMLHTKHQANV